MNKYGITSSTTTNAADGYGDSTTDDLNDWGTNIGTGWRTLTSAEWTYLLSTRKVTVGVEQASYGQGNVEGKNGLIILPDNWDGSVDANFTYGNSEWSNVYSSTTTPTWAQMEAAGCAFLPAAGSRFGTSVDGVGTYGFYWSSTPDGSDANKAYYLRFNSTGLNSDFNSRYYAFSVRLVLDVE